LTSHHQTSLKTTNFKYHAIRILARQLMSENNDSTIRWRITVCTAMCASDLHVLTADPVQYT